MQEALTGYRIGCAELALEGEPRPEYAPGVPLMARYQAKAAELGVSGGTVRRWVAALQDPARPGRRRPSARPAPTRWTGSTSAGWRCARRCWPSTSEASRPIRSWCCAEYRARLAARARRRRGPGAGAAPGYGCCGSWTRGTNAFTGSTKGKRSIAARPQGVYGRLRATRPGEYLLLDTTPLDVFAMEPVTLRWVRCELTIAMDLYSRCITGLRLSPVSTKSVDAALVLFETLRPGSRQHDQRRRCCPTRACRTRGGRPGDWRRAGRRCCRGRGGDRGGRPREDLPVDTCMSVCQRLGISVQPARPLTPTDKAAVERFFRTLSEGLLAALPGYKGPDVYSRGADPEGCAYFFTR